MFKCPRCIQEFTSYVGLSLHARNAHKLSGASLYREYHNIPTIPLCKCGCGKETKWRSDTGYNNYVAGHNSKGEGNVMFGKTHSQEARDSISKTRKKKFANGEYAPVDREHWSEVQKSLWASEGYKEHMKEAREASGWREKLSISHMGEKNHWYGKKRPEHSKLMKTPDMLRKVFAKRSMTNIERTMADMLDSLNVEYHSQFFIALSDQTFSYDFKLKGRPILIEVDGDYWHGGPGTTIHVPYLVEVTDNDTLKNEVANERGYTVLRFWGSDIMNTPQQVIDAVQAEINKSPL